MSELSAASSASPEVENPESTHHTKDSDCTSGDGEPCPDCGGRSFHVEGCAEMIEAERTLAPESIPPTPQQKTSAGLRAMAAWYDQHPNAPTPSVIELPVYGFDASPEQVRAIGTAKKIFDAEFIKLRVEGDGFALRFVEFRSKVCTKKLVGTKTIPASKARTVTYAASPEREEPVYEWDCPESLLAPDQE